MEKLLYNWFLKQREKHVPITSEILRAKAKFFYEKLTGKNDFLASNGWLCKFKARYGIRYLKVCGERVSSDAAAVIPFQKKFSELVAEMDLTKDQIYNADETAAFWRVLPGNTWVHASEQSAPGRKISKDRVTFMPCCNAGGTHKLPLLVIGKFSNPRAFKNVHLPVVYKATARGWMTRDLFIEWFKTCFIPSVKRYLKDVNKPKKALLLLDNAPSHPSEEELNSIDPNFKVMFLPPNCTALIQPMDQNLIQNIKIRYRKLLLQNIISQENEDIVKILKNYNLKDAVINLNRAWQSISVNNIDKSWSQLLQPRSENNEWDEEDEIPLTVLAKAMENEDLVTINETLQKIEGAGQLTAKEIKKWATGENEIDLIECIEDEDDEANTKEDHEEDDEVVVTKQNRVKNTDAAKSFSLCIQWAEENDISLQDILVLKRLSEKARDIHLKTLKQSTMANYVLHL